MKKRIAFFRPKPWPLANVKVAEELGNIYPGYELEIFNIEDLVKARRLIVIMNALITLFTFSSDLAGGKKKFKEAFWRTPFIFFQVKKLIKEKIAGQVYSFTFQMQSLFDCSIEGIPHFIYTDHTHLANLNYPSPDHRKLYIGQWTDLERTVYENASLIFVRSSNIMGSLIDQYGQNRTKIALVGAGNNIDSKMVRAGGEKINAGKNILFVGIDWERKGGPDLIKAFKKVLEKHPDATLTIVGAKPDIKNLPNCIIIGKVPPEQVSQYFESASVFCMPTRVEPFGIVFLEAMQAGLPIIGTNVGAIPDFLTDGVNGFLIHPGDIASMAEAMIKLLDDPDLRKKIGRQNIDLVLTQYSWDVVGQKIRNHINKHLTDNG